MTQTNSLRYEIRVNNASFKQLAQAVTTNILGGGGTYFYEYLRTYAAPTAGGVLNPACSVSDVRYHGKMRKSCIY